MSIHRFGYVRVAAAVPMLTLANPLKNADEMARMVTEADAKGVDVLVFPELGLTGYTCRDLFHQAALQKAWLRGLQRFLDKTRDLSVLCAVGMPLFVDDQLFNVAVMCYGGKPLAVVPKTHLANSREFEEPRWFASSTRLTVSEVLLCGETVPIGIDVLTRVFIDGEQMCVVYPEICEDVWVPTPKSSLQSSNGANIFLNLSASPSAVGKAGYRRSLVTQQSARCIAAYLYAGCGVHESTSSLIFDGHAMIADNGALVVETERFARGAQLIMADIDVERLTRDRAMTGSFGESKQMYGSSVRYVRCDMPARVDGRADVLLRAPDAHPFVPSNASERDERCEETFKHLEAGLLGRLEYMYRRFGEKIPEVKLGISGGLDSLLVLLIVVRAYDLMGWGRKKITAITMPGAGTADRTYHNAVAIAKALGVSFEEHSIVDAVTLHLRQLGHEPCWQCLMCQNAQARERTQILMDRGFMLGTGDMSECGLGWCTYGADQQGMYNVISGVPKTLVRHLVTWVADCGMFSGEVVAILRDILDTPVSPELERSTAARKAPSTEEQIGPYELNDFFLYHVVRHGFAPSKILFLATQARFTGSYLAELIRDWLRKYYIRFQDAQYKRENVPDGIKIGSVSLDPRGTWRMPADAELTVWITELDGTL
jgi:NAD+ synthase (glutamine-hydrolysing)